MQCKGITSYWKTLVLVLAPFALLPLPLTINTQEAKCAYVILLCGVYWLGEVVPLAVTALIPALLLPCLGVAKPDRVVSNYFKDISMLLLGGCAVAIAVEYSNLHRRIALRVLLYVGTSPRWVMFGFMFSTLMLSMWINNTATAAMMVPIADAVLDELEYKEEEVQLTPIRRASQKSKDSSNLDNVVVLSPKRVRYQSIDEEEPERMRSRASSQLSKGMLLSIMYAANIGGTGVLTGSFPNLLLRETLSTVYDDNAGVNFSTWLVYNFPGTIITGLFGWWWLQKLFVDYKSVGKGRNAESVRLLIQRKYEELGPVSFHEAEVLGVFFMLVLLWMLREPGFMPGWGEFFKPIKIKDSAPAILAMFLLFALPKDLDLDSLRSGRGLFSSGPRPAALEWSIVHEKMPWGPILLIGGGLALADGAKVSGLSQWLGLQLASMEFLPPLVICLVVTLVTAVLTEIMSNTATATVILPVLLDMAISLKIHPLYFMLPSTVLASLAFMFPIGTPPNAIVYTTGKVSTWDMIKPGIVMKIFSIAVQMAMLYIMGDLVFDINTFPGVPTDEVATDRSLNLTVSTISSLLQNTTSPFS